jgi:hypothetical protein
VQASKTGQHAYSRSLSEQGGGSKVKSTKEPGADYEIKLTLDKENVAVLNLRKVRCQPDRGLD